MSSTLESRIVPETTVFSRRPLKNSPGQPSQEDNLLLIVDPGTNVVYSFYIRDRKRVDTKKERRRG